MAESKITELTGKEAQIIGAAREAFLAQGYDAISMDEVARRAGVSKQTIYSYYPSKGDLFLAVHERERRVLDKLFEMPSIATPEEAGLQLREIGVVLLETLLSTSWRALHRVTVAAAHHFPTLGKSIYESILQRQAELANLIERAVKAKALKAEDPQVAADQFLSLVRGQLFFRCLFDPTFNPSRTAIVRQVDQAVDCFLAEYGAPADERRSLRARARSAPSNRPR